MPSRDRLYSAWKASKVGASAVSECYIGGFVVTKGPAEEEREIDR